MKISFKDFLVNENKYYLGNRIGDILSSVQELQQNSEGMGARQLVANSSRIVDQIRGILHTTWSSNEEKYLKDLQKIGVALAKAIDEKDDLEEILPAVSSELEKVSAKLGTPTNSLGVSPKDSAETGSGNEEQNAPSQGKQQPKPKDPSIQNNQSQQQPPQQDANDQPPQQPQQPNMPQM